MAMGKLYIILVAMVVFLLASRVTSQAAPAPAPDSQPLDVDYFRNPAKFLEVCPLFKHITDNNCIEALSESVFYKTSLIITKDCCKQLLSFGRRCHQAYVNSWKHSPLWGYPATEGRNHVHAADLVRVGDEIYYECFLKVRG
ncbi:hypothetical protein SLEP1_g31661 [Rubroshorea leprosula]|uniref:Prolamin-like domain-containing protein n=1 Tax=Rubroshorea leprosula TaxID=152421 RepID=A0AAV5KAS2_9ROSI|nr:hypothetical protein SLEP1_g31661 [Rubroshorea leprosula]